MSLRELGNKYLEFLFAYLYFPHSLRNPPKLKWFVGRVEAIDIPDFGDPTLQSPPISCRDQ